MHHHQWQPHDLVFWDNRSLVHLAAGTPEHLRRKMYRTTVEGGTPYRCTRFVAGWAAMPRKA